MSLLLVAQLFLFSTAWRGGELVYRHGLGVLSLPQTEGEGHSHSHGEEHDHRDGMGKSVARDEVEDFGGMEGPREEGHGKPWSLIESTG